MPDQVDRSRLRVVRARDDHTVFIGEYTLTEDQLRAVSESGKIYVLVRKHVHTGTMYTAVCVDGEEYFTAPAESIG